MRLTKGNVTIGEKTRFGPEWTGRRCGAKTSKGTACQRPAVSKTGRCIRHGGKSTGPKTAEGRSRIAAAQTTHGRYTKEKRQAAKERAARGRQAVYEINRIEAELINAGVLKKNWRDW